MSRYFSQIHSQTWIDPRIKKLSAGAILLRIYLMSNHLANASGFYVFKPAYGAEDLPLTKAKVLTALDELQEQGFIKYNPDSHALLILDWFKHHRLASNTNAKHIITLFKRGMLPQNELELETVLYSMLVDATTEHSENPNFAEFFEFLDSRTELPEILQEAVKRNRLFEQNAAPLSPAGEMGFD